MADLELIVLVGFRLVNFGVVIAIGYYFFKTQLLPGLRAQMQADRKDFDTLSGKVKSLHGDQEILEHAIIKDRIEQQRLKAKVLQWHDALELKRARLVHEQDQRREKLAAYYNDQIAHIQRDHTAKEILPFVIEKTRARLMNECASPSNQAAYFEHVVGIVKKMGSS